MYEGREVREDTEKGECGMSTTLKKLEYYSEMQRIIEGALKHDQKKVLANTELLIAKFKKNDETHIVESLEKLIASASRYMDPGLMRSPIDNESRLPMTDTIQPSEAADAKIVLNAAAKAQIDKFLLYYENLEKLSRASIRVPNSVLFFGPPGCGKTKSAVHICAKIELPLVIARLDGMISSYLGSTSKHIRAIFDYAQSVPCILFLDEFDAIAKIRDDKNEMGELKRVVNSLLQNIDSIKSGSIMMAATNHEHLLDPAIWRRFGFKISIEKPDDNSIMELIDLFLPHNPIGAKHKEIIASAMSGLSGADIEEICTKTLIDSVLQDRQISVNSLFDNLFDFLSVGEKLNKDNSASIRAEQTKKLLRHIDGIRKESEE